MKKLFIVSNRLPISVETTDQGYTLRQSSGGLVSAINAYLSGGARSKYSQTIWAGVPDCTPEVWQKVAPDTGQYEYAPVFVEPKLYEHYYNGFSNSMLWPLFHYFPSFADYSSAHFDAYMQVNHLFAETLSTQLTKDDVVWIHDYHLLPLAGMLRQRFPALTIGFFLHIPFPSYELLRVIPKPWQREILTGMLGADLIGFHTFDYAAHFLSSVEMMLRVEHEDQLITWDNRHVKVEVFPISIDYNLFHNAYDDPEVSRLREKHIEMKGTRKLIFSVDRLDYTKGVSNRLRGYEKFLADHPDYREQVIFALVLVPSRDSISMYSESKKIIDLYISDLNSRLGTIGWQPVIYQYNHLSFAELVSLYTACDVALITPLRDGMNLVSKEFVASRKDKQGVLILSEMAGAARELTESLSINPNDSNEISQMIRVSLEMNPDEQAHRMTLMQQRIKQYDVNAWADDFFRQLNMIKEAQLEFEIKFIDPQTERNILEHYTSASRRLLLLDYDGTLEPFSHYPQRAFPREPLLKLLKKLAQNPDSDVYIISGRDAATLDQWLGHLDIGLIAEHGAKIKPKGGAWKTEITSGADKWNEQIEELMERYVARCPNSFIEKKEFSIAWHYRNSDFAQSGLRARELYNELVHRTFHSSLNILNGNKVIEVRTKGINKGTAIEKVVSENAYDFILSIGDDQTDEDMFKKLAKTPHAYTIKVGSEASFAKYNLSSTREVKSLLEDLSRIESIKPQE